MEERITPHLQGIIRNDSQAVKIQFEVLDQREEEILWESDPLGEESHYSPIKGLVHKFENRVLWKVSYRCAAHCQFCTRSRQIGSSEGDLTDEDISSCLNYISSHPEVDDVILSGGDPLYTPHQTMLIIEGLKHIPTVRVVRIDTRLPVHAPASMKSRPLVDLMEKVRIAMEEKSLYLLLHVNHSDELVPETREAIKNLRRMGIPLLSQSVFLKDVNDNVEILAALFRELYYLGVIPYYIYRCDYVCGLERFICDFEKEREIMTQLRIMLSGIAMPTYVVDVPGRGKLPVPLKFWDVPYPDKCVDFDNNPINL